MTSVPCEGGSGPQREASLGLCRDQPGMDTETIATQGAQEHCLLPIRQKPTENAHTIQRRNWGGRSGFTDRIT